MLYVTDHSVLEPSLMKELGFDPVDLPEPRYIDRDSDEPDLGLVVAFLETDEVARLRESHWRWHVVKLGTQVEQLREGYVLGRLVSSHEVLVLVIGAVDGAALPRSDMRGEIAAVLFSGIREARRHAVKLSAASYSLVQFDLIGKGYCDLLDDLVNYTDLDSRVYDLAVVLRKRLSEFQLKLRNRAVDWRDQVADAQLDFTTGVVDQEGTVLIWPASTDAVHDLWETIDLAATHNAREFGRSLSEEIEPAISRLEVARDMAQALAQEAAERVSSSTNMVLYGLSIITVGFSLLAFFDKYQSADTLGLGWAQAFGTTAVVSVVLCALLVATALRHGTLMPWLAKQAKLLRLWALDSTVHGAVGHLPGLRGYRNDSLSKLWFDWYEWKLSQLIHWGLPAMENTVLVETKSDIERLLDLEVRTEQIFYDLWMDMRLKQAHVLLEGPAKKPGTTAQVDRLLARGKVSLAVDFTFLEIPDACPAPQIVCALTWLQPELEHSNRTNLGFGGSDALRAYFDRFSENILGGDGPSGSRLYRRYAELTVALVKSRWADAPGDDGLIWRSFEEKVLDGNMIPLEWLEWVEDMDFEHIVDAYDSISLSSLVGDIFEAAQAEGEE